MLIMVLFIYSGILDNLRIHHRVLSLLIQLYSVSRNKEMSRRQKPLLISEMQARAPSERKFHRKDTRSELKNRETAENELQHAEWYWGDISK